MKLILCKMVTIDFSNKTALYKEIEVSDNFVPTKDMFIYYDLEHYFKVGYTCYFTETNLYTLYEDDTTLSDKFSYKMRYPTKEIEESIKSYIDGLKDLGWSEKA